MNRKQKILLMIQNEARQIDIAEELGVSKQLIRQYLLTFLKKGLVKKSYPYVLTKQGKLEASPKVETGLTSKD